MAVADPDVLLKKVSKPGLAGDIVISIIIHALLLGLTSFSLYPAWAKWGIHAPNEIKRLEKEAAKEEAKKAAQAEADAKAQAAAEEQARADEAADAAKAAAGEKGEAREAMKKVDEAEKAVREEAAKKAEAAKELPLDKEVAAPPKKFDNLDDIGLD